MIELLLAALAATAVLIIWWGWRRSRETPGHGLNFGGDYFRGLNYLLNEQPDKALEVFLQLAEVNHDTVETHLALGNLFRRRGQVDHAIRCHQNIIAKESISTAERHHALLELAEDYRRAGLLDRAEDLYHQLTEQADNRHQALDRLLEIYEQEKDWDQSIHIAQRLHALDNRDMGSLIAHFYCELAADALGRHCLEEARTALNSAQQYHPESLRQRLLAARLQLREGHPRDAVNALRRALNDQPDLLPVALDTLNEAYNAADASSELQEQLTDWLEQRQDVSATMVLVRLYHQSGHHQQAITLLLNQLQKRPNVRLLQAFLERASDAQFAEHSHRLRPILAQLTDQLLDDEVAFRCRQCGFGGHTHHWQCPSCRHWDTTWPVRGVTGE